jgi:PAS domain S-box-containing protein
MLRKFFNLSIKFKLLIGFLTIACLSGLIALSTFYSIYLLDNNKADFDAILNIKEEIHSLQMELNNKEGVTISKNGNNKSFLTIEKNLKSIDLKSNKQLKTISTKRLNALKANLSNTSIETFNLTLNKIHKSVSNDQKSITFATKVQNIALMIFGTIVALSIAFMLSNYIVNHIHLIRDNIDKLKKGNLPDVIEVDSKDEIAEITSSINELTLGIKNTSQFAGEIGKGNFEKEFQPLSDEDVLGNSLLSMRVNLIKVAEDEKKRNWATEGLAKFGDILRANNEGLELLADNIISNLVKYLNANQGGLFVVNDSNPDDKHLELMACYAWNKKKYLHMRIEEGDGLVGQCWQENDTLYVTDVPKNFVKITSGLGDANPNSFLIVPLSVNDEIFGVVEIASFNYFEEYQIEFVNKLAESIASTLSTAKTNERTKHLLEQSQAQTEQMRAQEEEMRQNMEEMAATQEEMERKEIEMTRMLEQQQQQEEEMRQNMEEMQAIQEQMESSQQEMQAQKDIIDSVAIVSKTDVLGNITYVNDQFLKWSKYTREEVMGKNHRILRHEDMPAAAFDDLWKTISSGKIWRGEVLNKAKDGSVYWVDAIIAPVLDEYGKPKEYIAQRFVINDQKERERKMQEIIEKTTAQEEEIRQNLEEMQATQEEMELVQRQMEAQNSIINSTAIVSKTDLLGNITYVNDEFVKWAKYSREEVMGKNHRILRHEDMPAAAFEDMWKTISSGNIWRGEVKNKAKDGSIYWVDAIIAPIMDENGKPKEYIAQRFVINEQKAKQEEMAQMLEETRAQEEEIRQNLEEMQAIQEDMERQQREMLAQTNIINSVAIVSKTDLQGNITYVNDEFVKWAKYSKHEALGQNHRILRHPSMPDAAFEDMWKTISSGQIWRGEVLNKAKDGSEYWVDAIIAPILDDSGKPKEYIAQRFVINEKKEQEQKMHELIERLKDKN